MPDFKLTKKNTAKYSAGVAKQHMLWDEEIRLGK